MCSKAQHNVPIQEVLAPPGKYVGMIRQLPVRNIISTQHFMDI